MTLLAGNPSRDHIIDAVNSLEYSGAYVYKNAADSIADSAHTAVTFEVEDTDIDGYFDSGSPTRFTIPTGKGGLFRVETQVWLQSSITTADTNFIYARIMLNGTTDIAVNQIDGPSGAQVANPMTRVIRLSDGDYVESTVFHNFGAPVNTEDEEGRAWFSIQRLGD